MADDVVMQFIVTSSVYSALVALHGDDLIRSVHSDSNDRDSKFDLYFDTRMCARPLPADVTCLIETHDPLQVRGVSAHIFFPIEESKDEEDIALSVWLPGS